MELWIRSQDKENLVKTINKIGLHYLNKNMIIANYQPDFVGTQGEYYEKLGTYKTKERALEVLDEIQNILKPTIKIKYEYDDNQPIMNGEWLKSLKKESKIEELSTYVYEMPEN